MGAELLAPSQSGVFAVEPFLYAGLRGEGLSGSWVWKRSEPRDCSVVRINAIVREVPNTWSVTLLSA